ncbi:MAG TPA: M28 family peptidase, partial [Chthoniobacterales bacterium]|nr:M28 family peptidase [Chthoniobacterales bacterium]
MRLAGNEKQRLRHRVRFAGLLVLAALPGSCKPPVVQGRPWEEFSGAKALAHVQALVDFGPRPPGSDAIKRARAYIRDNLRATGWEVLEQPVTRQTPRGAVTFVNLIARRPNEWHHEGVYLVASHYDTKIFDSIRFVGANDGGSSTGALLELARVLDHHRGLAA